MDYPIELTVSAGGKGLKLLQTEKVALLKEENGELRSLETVKIRPETLLLASYTDPVQVLFCWDGDCDTVEPSERAIAEYLEGLLKESPDAVEEVSVMFLYPLFSNRKNKYFVGVYAIVEVEND